MKQKKGSKKMKEKNKRIVLNEHKSKMKNEIGITLIALVITIIVMLILVAVTVNYGIKSGLLEKAKYAKNKYDEEQSRENNLENEIKIGEDSLRNNDICQI